MGGNPINGRDSLGLSDDDDLDERLKHLENGGGIGKATHSYDDDTLAQHNAIMAQAGEDLTEAAKELAKAAIGGVFGKIAGRGSKLFNNCEKAGKPVKKGLEDAHHIVAKAAKRAQPARDKLKEYGVDIDDAFNGIGLPKDFHKHLHTKEYYDMVNEAAENWHSYDDIVKGLKEIADDLVKKAAGN